jgi:hypothetical protein
MLVQLTLDQIIAKIARAERLLAKDGYVIVGDETKGVRDMMLSVVQDVKDVKAFLSRKATGK